MSLLLLFGGEGAAPATPAARATSVAAVTARRTSADTVEGDVA